MTVIALNRLRTKHRLRRSYNPHIPAEHLFVGSHLPGQILRGAVDGREIVERHERDVFHENIAGSAGGFLVS